MPRTKLLKINKYLELPNTFGTSCTLRGAWATFFNNFNPITLELAAGAAALTLQLAEKYPARNFIAVDGKSHRLYTAARLACEKSLPNVAFLNIRIERLEEYFSSQEVQAIWITFPEPHVKRAREKHRLTHKTFLERYKNIISNHGQIFLKTDSQELYVYTLESLALIRAEILECFDDIYTNKAMDNEDVFLQTKYEQFFLNLGRKIKYVGFKLATE